RRIDTLGAVVSTQARTDGALLGEVHRRSQATGTQQQRQLGRLTLTIKAGDAELATQRGLDGGQTDDLLLFLEGGHRYFLLDAVDHLLDVAGQRLLLDEDHRHAAPDVVAGGTIHQLATMAIEADVHLWTTILVIAGLGIGDLVTGDDQAALQRHRRTTGLTELEGLGGGARRVRLGLQAELQV